MPTFANDFTEILQVLSANADLRAAVEALAMHEAMPGKVTEGGDRLSRFRSILRDLITGNINLQNAYERTENELPRANSSYASDNRVFATGWGERLVRTQLSRCYNQAVMEFLVTQGHTQCFVPHSTAEDSTTSCSQQLAGANHDIKTLHDLLVKSYRDGVWTKDVKIPNHPHCTHTVIPAK